MDEPRTESAVLRELADRAVIREVMARYGRGLDRRDFELVRGCFTENATADYGGAAPLAEGIEAILRVVRVVERFISTTHFMGDQLVEFAGDAAADVETYAVDHLRYERDGITYDMTGGLRYVDRMVRKESRWLIERRVMHTDWRRRDPVVDAPSPYGGR